MVDVFSRSVGFEHLGFDAEERTWESLRKIHSSAPDFVLKELRMEFLCDRMRFRLGFCLAVRVVRLTPKQASGVL